MDLCSNVMSLHLNMLSRFVIVFLPRSKHFLISWLQSPSAAILEPKKIKVSHCFHCFPIYLPWSMGLDTMILVLGSPSACVSAISFSLPEKGFTFLIVKFPLTVACCVTLEILMVASYMFNGLFQFYASCKHYRILSVFSPKSTIH